MDLQGKTALVTGASSGIGAEVARALGAAGVTVALSARREDRLRELADSIASTCRVRPLVLPADLSLPGGAAAVGQRALDALGTVHILVNAAGTFGTGAPAGDGEDARALFETNYWAPLGLARTLVPGMQAAGGGAVVNLTSLATVTPLPSMAGYPASKAALSSATEALRLELAGSNVHVILAFLGGVDTPMHAAASRSYGNALRWMPLGRPEIAARRIVDAIRRGRETIVYPRSVAMIRMTPAVSAWVSRRLLIPLLLGDRRCARRPCVGSC